MPPPNIEMDEILATKPYQTMQGHTWKVYGVVYLPTGRRIITCSWDGSLRLWDLKSGAQIGEDWRDGEDKERMSTIALSPNGDTVASGSWGGTVRLWSVETGKVIAKWKGHTGGLKSVWWSASGDRVIGGSWDGTVRVWDVENGKTVLGPIEAGHEYVSVAYSPDSTKFATAGYNESGVKIWDAKSGELLTTIKHDNSVWSLAWTSNGKKLISGSYRIIRIINTATWQQIAVLQGHTEFVNSISLSQNDNLLVSASNDHTARLWNLDTNLPIGNPLQHEERVRCATLSADGTVLVTGCDDNNAYAWDIQAILRKSGHENLLPTPNVAAEESFTDADHMKSSAQLEDTCLVPLQGYVVDDDTPDSIHSSVTRHPNNDEIPQFQQPSRQGLISHSLDGVAAVKDKGLHIAPQPKQAQPQHAQTASTSTPSRDTTAPGAPVAQLRPIIIDKPTGWTRFWLFLCCPSARYADS